jgi:hypothetical protein
VEALETWRIKRTSWLDGSIYATPGTESPTRTARLFDDDAEGARLQQAYFALERAPKTDCGLDWGGNVAVLWGTDARYTHARGMLDQQTGEYQFDLLEANAQIGVGVAGGLTVKAGKFTTPMGFEVIEAPSNLLPSRSFLFNYAIPFTHAGALATLQASERISVSYGLLLGWDVWEDDNDALSNLGAVTWKSPSERDTVILNLIVGAERPDDDDDLRSVLDATWTHTWSDLWKTTVNADFGFEQGAAPDGGEARWWGVAGYVTRTFSSCLSATLRAEYFRDRDGTRLGTPASLTELTLGLDWTPIPCLTGLHVRPEVRWDHSFDGVFFDGGTDADQVSLTLDAYVTF